MALLEVTHLVKHFVRKQGLFRPPSGGVVVAPPRLTPGSRRVPVLALLAAMSAEDAEDVTTEIFLRIIENLRSFTWRGLPFGAWVFRIARNEVVSHVRRQKVRTTTGQLTESIQDPSPDHVDELVTAFTVATVRAAAERLPEAQRQVIACRFGAGLSVAETAQALGKTENNVKVLQHKAIAKLQIMVRDQ